MQSDLFLSKINLLLLQMYASALADCELVDAEYSWMVDGNTVVSTILYTISYECPQRGNLTFMAQISNNVLTVLTVPEGVEEGANSTQKATSDSADGNATLSENGTSQGSSTSNATKTPPVV
jgi:hypothetical protein